jgi:predicted RNA-binding Zn ribbon-like protein
MQSAEMRAGFDPHKLDFIGDHLALDFINTERAHLGELVELFKSDKDVKDWLSRAGVTMPAKIGPWKPGILVKKALQLRVIARMAIEAKKAGKRPSLDALNAFLEHAGSYPQIILYPRSRMEIRRIYGSRTAEEFLAPVAESVADLLINGDFELVRPCEGDKCVLWFYDRTKAHRRRWCSPTECGNRAKVAAFRARSHERSKPSHGG